MHSIVMLGLCERAEEYLTKRSIRDPGPHSAMCQADTHGTDIVTIEKFALSTAPDFQRWLSSCILNGSAGESTISVSPSMILCFLEYTTRANFRSRCYDKSSGYAPDPCQRGPSYPLAGRPEQKFQASEPKPTPGN